MEIHLQYVSNLQLFRELVKKWWSQSKFFRITALVTGSITGLLSIRYLYVKTKRKYYGYPPGPMGPPFVGYVCTSTSCSPAFESRTNVCSWQWNIEQSLMRFNPEWLCTVPEQYGHVTDVGMSWKPIWCCSYSSNILWIIGRHIHWLPQTTCRLVPTILLITSDWLYLGGNLVLINDPVLAKKLHDDPRASKCRYTFPWRIIDEYYRHCLSESASLLQCVRCSVASLFPILYSLWRMVQFPYSLFFTHSSTLRLLPYDILNKPHR